MYSIKMIRQVLFLLLPMFSIAQTITHITEVPAITDLPCLSVHLGGSFDNLRIQNCPQPSPLSYGSCLCLQSPNVRSLSSSMSLWGSLLCADRSSIDSSMAMDVFSSYCSLQLAGKEVVASTTSTSPNSFATYTSISPNSTPTSTMPLSTPKITDTLSPSPSPTSTPTSKSPKDDSTQNILLGTIIPGVTLIVQVILWLLGRRIRQNEAHTQMQARPPSVMGVAMQDWRRGYVGVLSPVLHGIRR